ncbi:Conserved_hypothetical protein [Hexamita inflata]|uniref:Uncharacterized protein n=1 Tax=Hexamita inflata TaxID=28002 RepID=A0ABP1H3V6_9EUKA
MLQAIQQTKTGKYSSKLFQFNTSTAQQLERVGLNEYQNELITYARIIPETKLTVVSHQCIQTKQIITDVVFADAKPLTIDIPNHYIHLLTEDYMLIYDPRYQLQLVNIKRNIFKNSLKMESTHLVKEGHGQVVFMQGFNNYFVLVQQCQITILTLIQFHDNELKIVSQLTSSSFNLAEKKAKYYFQANSYPVLVINQGTKFLVVNFYRRETLDFEIPIRQTKYKCHSQWQKYLLDQSQQFSVFMNFGLGIACQLDPISNKQRVVLFSCSLNTPTRIWYSTVDSALSYDPMEINDLMYCSQLFMMAGVQNLPVKTAIKYVMQHIGLFIGQFANKRVENYNQIQKCKQHPQLIDIMPQEIMNILRNEKTQSIEEYQLTEDILDYGYLIQVFQRYVDRFKAQNQSQLFKQKKLFDPAQEDQEQEVKQKEAQIFPILFNYNQNKSLEQTVKEVLMAFRQMNPSRTRTRRSMSIGAEDSDMELPEQQGNTKSETSTSQALYTGVDLSAMLPNSPNLTEKEISAELQQELSLIPCPTIFSYAFDLFTQQRFIQLPFQLVNSVKKITCFDFYLQQIVTFDFQSEINHFDSFENLVTEQLKQSSKDFVKIQAQCLYQSMQADILMNGYWNSGISSQSYELLSSFIQQWNSYVGQVLESDMLDTKLAGQLIITKTIVDCYFSVVNFQIPGQKVVLCHIAQAMNYLIDNKHRHLIELHKMLEDADTTAKNDEKPTTVSTLLRSATIDMGDLSYAQQYTSAREIQSEQNYALPTGDGHTTQYGSMPMIILLGIFNDSYLKSFITQVSQMSFMSEYPKYYQQNQIQIKIDKQYDWNHRILKVYNKCRYLYGNMQYRGFYKKTMSTFEHSPIMKSAFEILKQYEVMVTSSKDVDRLAVAEHSRVILQTCSRSFANNLDYVAQKVYDLSIHNHKVQVDQMIALCEVVELTGSYCDNNLREIVKKYILESELGEEVVQQLYSYGVIDYSDIYLG